MIKRQPKKSRSKKPPPNRPGRRIPTDIVLFSNSSNDTRRLIHCLNKPPMGLPREDLLLARCILKQLCANHTFACRGDEIRPSNLWLVSYEGHPVFVGKGVQRNDGRRGIEGGEYYLAPNYSRKDVSTLHSLVDCRRFKYPRDPEAIRAFDPKTAESVIKKILKEPRHFFLEIPEAEIRRVIDERLEGQRGEAVAELFGLMWIFIETRMSPGGDFYNLRICRACGQLLYTMKHCVEGSSWDCPGDCGDDFRRWKDRASGYKNYRTKKSLSWRDETLHEEYFYNSSPINFVPPTQ